MWNFGVISLEIDFDFDNDLILKIDEVEAKICGR